VQWSCSTTHLSDDGRLTHHLQTCDQNQARFRGFVGCAGTMLQATTLQARLTRLSCAPTKRAAAGMQAKKTTAASSWSCPFDKNHNKRWYSSSQGSRSPALLLFAYMGHNGKPSVVLALDVDHYVVSTTVLPQARPINADGDTGLALLWALMTAGSSAYTISSKCLELF
jgi:hypothetical protein